MRKTLCCWLALAVIAGAQSPSIPALVHLLHEQSSSEQAMRDMRRIWETDRWFTFPKFEETAQNVAAMMRRAGLEQVEIVRPLADGVTQYGYWTMPLAWDVKHATLEIVAPEVSAGFRVLADYEKIPTSLGMWSGPTPRNGLTAEVIAVSGRIEDADLRGKFVLMDRNPAGFKWQLAKKGALGAINTFTENKDLPDGRQWINAWGDNGWAFTKGSTPLPCFSLSPRQSAYLRTLLEKGTVRLRAKVESRYYGGVYPYVTGVIRGSGQSGEEVLALGHLFEQGANDNATGVSAMIGAAETLHRLIAAGKLARPQRTIRILALGECYGSMHYVTTNAERVKKTVAAMCLDTPAGPYNLAGTEYTWYLNPDPARSYVDALILRLAAEYFPLVSRPWHDKPYMSGTDNYLGEPSIGIPTAWPYSGTGVHTHHNSADTPETVDARSLRDVMAISAAYLYYITAAGPTEARAAADLAAARACTDLATAGDPSRAKQGLAAALERVDYELDLGRQAVRSAARLGKIDDLAGLLDACAQKQRQRLRQALGQAAPPHAPSPAAAKIIVRRKRPGTITLDDLSPDRREGYPAAAFGGPPVTALYWCDGKRNLAEVIRLTELEIGASKFDFVGYFKFLQRHGYVEFVQ
jgi:hypothetical protein